MTTINYIFSTGFRCTSRDTLEKLGVFRFNSPFEYLFIDVETAMKIIGNKFEDFLNDIVYINKKENKIKLLYEKNTDKIKDNLLTFFEKDIIYVDTDHNHHDIFINQNYINDDELNNNHYHWKNTLIFIHHILTDKSTIHSLKIRIKRFMYILENFSKDTCLLHTTRILNSDVNLEKYMENFMNKKRENNINCYFILIMNCEKINDIKDIKDIKNIKSNYLYNEENKCLFLFIKVDNYEKQRVKHRVDEFEFTEEHKDIIKKFFIFDIIEKENLCEEIKNISL